MAKYYNTRVKTGKLAGSVFAIRNGETIERAYQPVVSNPRTEAQIAARAKLKLMSQLSAVMGPYIAIPRMGTKSSRNLFVKQNYGLSTYANDQADINLNNVQLTKSVLAIPQILVTKEGTLLSIGLTTTEGSSDLSRVVYVAMVKQTDGRLRYYNSAVVSTAGEGNRFGTTMPVPTLPVVVYAYGVRDNTEVARVKFGEMSAPSAESVASVIVTSQLLESDVTLTETTAMTLIPS